MWWYDVDQQSNSRKLHTRWGIKREIGYSAIRTGWSGGTTSPPGHRAIGVSPESFTAAVKFDKARKRLSTRQLLGVCVPAGTPASSVVAGWPRVQPKPCLCRFRELMLFSHLKCHLNVINDNELGNGATRVWTESSDRLAFAVV